MSLFKLDASLIDFEEMRRQKTVLFTQELAANNRYERKGRGEDLDTAEAISGILNFLDYMMDEAEKVVGFEAVFGKRDE